MKTFIYLSFSMFFLVGCLVACQKDGQMTKIENELKTKNAVISEVPASLNVVPEWVREKVTPEEYEMFKLISTRFRVDYSFLRENISEKRRAYLNERWEVLCQEINNGRYPEGSLWIYGVASESKKASFRIWGLESLETPEMDENEESRSKVMTVYTSSTYSDVSIVATITYTYNKKTGIASNVSISMNAQSSVPSRNPDFSGSCGADYNTGSKKIQGSCAGSLIFRVGDYNEIETIQNLQFTIEP